MLMQLIIGTATMIATVLTSAIFAYVAMECIFRTSPWIVRRPHNLRFLFVMVGVLIGTIAAITACVWVWAATFYWLEALPDLETSLYFAFASFTTLGFGDVLLPIEFRLLSGMAATNGLLLFGIYTAFLVEIMRRVREAQRRGVPDRD